MCIRDSAAGAPWSPGGAAAFGGHYAVRYLGATVLVCPPRWRSAPLCERPREMALRPPSAGGRLCSCLCGPLTIAAGLDRGVWAAAKVRVCLRSELQVAKSACRRTAEAAAAPRIVPEGHHEGPLRPRGDGRKRKRAHRPCSDAESAGRQAGADGRRHRPRGTAAASSLFHVLRHWLLRLDSPTNYPVAPESKLESELKRARQRRRAMPPGKFTCIRGRVGLSSREEPRRRWI